MPYSSAGCDLPNPGCVRGCGVSASCTLMLWLPCSRSGASAARRPAVGVTSRSTDCELSVKSLTQISGVSLLPEHAEYTQWHFSFASMLSDGMEAMRHTAGTPGITTSASPLVAGLLEQGCQNLPVSGEPARSC